MFVRQTLLQTFFRINFFIFFTLTTGNVNVKSSFAIVNVNVNVNELNQI